VFSRYAYFGAYHLDEYFAAGRRLLGEAPENPVLKRALRRLKAVRDDRPYVKALAVWGAQVEACQHHVRSAFEDRSFQLRYEEFCRAPVEHLESIYALQDRPLPDSVRAQARRSIDASRLRRWTEVPTAEQRFQEGVQRAQIAELMRDLGYDPS
ncbi:MAG: hypothetical protein ABEK84_03915, partial [Salinibacter sp.]